MDIKDGLLGKVPFVTIVIAIAMAVCFGSQIFGGVEGSGRYEAALLDAQSFFERNAGLETNARQRSLLGTEFINTTRAAQSARGDAPVFSERIQRRTQARFDGLCDEALDARMTEDPAWRHGITGTDAPAHRFFTYAFFHAGWLAFGVTLVFLLLAGLGLEVTWGPVFFAPVSLLAVVTGGIVFAVADASGQMPLSGGGPLVAALLGAYAVRGAGGHLPLPGPLLLGVWFFVDFLFVRGIWIDNIGDWPWATLGLSVVFGAGLSAGIRFMGVDAKFVDVAEKITDGRHPAIVQAERFAVLGQQQDAFVLLSEAAAEHPSDAELALAYWEMAVEVGRAEEAVHSILPVLQSELRTGDIEPATRHWRQVVATGVPVDVGTTVLVRMGEALLDVGEPEEALDNLRRALDAPGTMGSALAQRVVRIARDLDPVLTARAAEVALRDPQIDAETRADLEPLAGGGRSARARSNASDGPEPGTTGSPAAPAAESAGRDPLAGDGGIDAAIELDTTDTLDTTDAGSHSAAGERFGTPLGLDLGDGADTPLGLDPNDGLGDLVDDGLGLDESGIDLSHVGELTSPEEFASLGAGHDLEPMELDAPGAAAGPPPESDPNALSIHSLERELATGLHDEDAEVDVASWNDPGLVEDLSGELDSAPPSLIAEGDLDAPVMDDSYLDPGALSPEALSVEPSHDVGASAAMGDGLLGDDIASSANDSGPSLQDATDPLQDPLPALGGTDVEASALDAMAPVGREPESPPTEPLLGEGLMAAQREAAEADRVRNERTPDASTPPVAGSPAIAPDLEAAAGGGAPEVAAAAAASMRVIKVLDATPLVLEAEGLKLDIVGRGKTRLPFARIDAVAVAAVAGLSAKPVLVIDFVLNWNAAASEPLKVIRVRSDGFNPVSLIGSGGSPLEAIKTLIRRVLDGAQAVPLPDTGAVQGSPFSMQPDLESYQRDILMAI